MGAGSLENYRSQQKARPKCSQIYLPCTLLVTRGLGCELSPSPLPDQSPGL